MIDFYLQKHNVKEIEHSGTLVNQYRQFDETKIKKLPLGKRLLKGTFDLVTSVKQGKISYSENNGQLLPGYDETVGFLGGAPTSFAFGSQVDIRNKSLNEWVVGSSKSLRR